MAEFLPFLILLLVVAVLLREEALLTILYLLAGAYLVGRLWTHRAMASLAFRRQLPERAFLGEVVPVELEMRNRSILPLLWLQVHESLPSELATPNYFRRVLSLGGHAQVRERYLLHARKRGLYSIGPLEVKSGDFLGLAGEVKAYIPANQLIVYPKIIPLVTAPLSSRFPHGTLKHTAAMFEDPARPLSKRDYVSGDSLRRVDWKASAVVGNLQVKVFESSLALQVMLFLNLNRDEYDLRWRHPASELAIVAAASLTNWVKMKKQAVGLATNGIDPTAEGAVFPPIAPKRGRGHMMRILEVLARVQTGTSMTFVELIQRTTPRLNWGTTVVMLTTQANGDLVEEIFKMQRRGLIPILLLFGAVPGFSTTRRRLERFGVPAFLIRDESDLDAWRR